MEDLAPEENHLMDVGKFDDDLVGTLDMTGESHTIGICV